MIENERAAALTVREALAELVAYQDYEDTGLGMSLERYVRSRPLAWAAARAALAATPESGELPPLPRYIGHLHSDGDFCQDRAVETPVWWPIELFTADQMQDYARAALTPPDPVAALTERRMLVSKIKRLAYEMSEQDVDAVLAPSGLSRQKHEYAKATGKDFEVAVDELAALTPLAPLEPPIQPFDHAHPDSWKYEAQGHPAGRASEPSNGGTGKNLA